MGVIDSAIEATETADTSDAPDPDGPYHAKNGSPIDPFLTVYEMDNVEIDDKTVDRLLGALVIVSNAFG